MHTQFENGMTLITELFHFFDPDKQGYIDPFHYLTTMKIIESMPDNDDEENNDFFEEDKTEGSEEEMKKKLEEDFEPEVQGKVTLAEWVKSFTDEWDENPQGQPSISQIEKLQQVLLYLKNPSEYEVNFQKQNQLNNDNVDKDIFDYEEKDIIEQSSKKMKMTPSYTFPEAEELIVRIFHSFDVNQDGFLDVKEFTNLINTTENIDLPNSNIKIDSISIASAQKDLQAFNPKNEDKISLDEWVNNFRDEWIETPPTRRSLKIWNQILDKIR